MILAIGTTPTLQRTMAFDRLVIDDVNRAAEVHEHASGKGVNVARVLTTLGEPALAAGFLGGRRGDALREDLRRSNVPHDMVDVARETRLCTTVIDRATGQVTELVEEAPPASPMEWAALVGRITTHLPRATAMVFSGTLAPGAPADFIDRWIGQAPVVLVDAKGEPMRRALAAPSGRLIAKLNRQELSATLGRPLETDDDLHRAVRENAPRDGWLIVTLGKDGAIGWADGRLWRVTSPPAQVVSPIGSGDAFAAGLIAGHPKGPKEALRLACACGVANALTPFSGHLRIDDVRTWTGLVDVRALR
jgi:tagatose 6-phosphate kinase